MEAIKLQDGAIKGEYYLFQYFLLVWKGLSSAGYGADQLRLDAGFDVVSEERPCLTCDLGSIVSLGLGQSFWDHQE